MRIYFSCSLTGGRDDEHVYGVIVDFLVALGHEVPTAHLASPKVMAAEAVVDPGEVYQRDVEWIQACDALIAEVSTPSHGVGFEIAYALSQGKPALCCYKQGVPVSKMLLGNDSPGFVVRAYQTEGEALSAIEGFLEALEDRGGKENSDEH